MNVRRIRVVHIVEGFLGGTSTYVCSVLPQLVKRGFDVTLVCSLERSRSDWRERLLELRESGVKVHVTAMKHGIDLLRDLRSLAALFRFLGRNRFDVAHTHCSKAGALGRVAAVMAGYEAILHSPHCFAFQRGKSRLKNWLSVSVERLLGRVTTRLIAVSQSEAQVALRHGIVPPGRCTWINNGLSANGRLSTCLGGSAEAISLRQQFRLDANAAVVTTACRLVDYKGIFRFLEAAEICRTPGAAFLVAGEGELQGAVEEFVWRRKLSERVRLLGHVADMNRLYGICDIVVLCSDAEAQPFVLLEAMRAGCVVVATSVVGNRELIWHGRTGLLTDSTAAGVAAAIDALLADGEKRDLYARNAREYFRAHHTLEQQVAKLARTYERCIYNGKHGTRQHSRKGTKQVV